MKLYVSNLHYDATEIDLRNEFGQFGKVVSARIVLDRDTGRSRGFGFVEMGSEAEGRAAIKGISGYELRGRAVNVAQAQERKPGDRPAGNSYRRA